MVSDGQNRLSRRHGLHYPSDVRGDNSIAVQKEVFCVRGQKLP